MNINNMKGEKVTGDKLEFIFNRQMELLKKYLDIEEKNGLVHTKDVPVNLDSFQGQARLKDFAWRITEELGEGMNCLKNKPWKQTFVPTDGEHFKEELIDAFHFFVELLISTGIGADELVNYYSRKSQVNKFRIDSNY